MGARESVHAVALAAMRFKADAVRYACEQLGRPKTEQVRVWLKGHGIETSRSSTSTVVNAWRRERGLSDTGDLPAFTDEVLDELAARAARTTPTERVPSPVGGSRGLTRLGTAGAYVAAVVATGVSAETSLKFFAGPLQVEAPARWFLFGVMELALIACGVMMAAGVRSERGTPGPARWVAWGLCGFAVVAAIEVSGPFDGPLRAVLGPVLAVIMLHLALGMDFSRRHGNENTGTLRRVGHELRERALSRLGLADDARTALTRTRDRAARRAARLVLAPRWAPLRRARLNRALRASNIAHEDSARERMLAELAVIRHADTLSQLVQPPPWNHTIEHIHATHKNPVP